MSDQSLRGKYWRIYYENNESEFRSTKFITAELKRLSNVSQRMKELNNERMKQSSKHQELDELNELVTKSSQQLSPDSPTSVFLSKFRRARSTSIPAVSLSDSSFIHRSFEVLCQTPLCKPPTLVDTNYS